jgi:hypothetical protein
MESKMNKLMSKFLATTRHIPTLAAVTIALVTSVAVAQNYQTGEPGEAPGVSATGGRPLPVNPAEVKRDNTADPGSAPLVSPDGGRPLPVDPAELRRDNTANPGGLPSARR